MTKDTVEYCLYLDGLRTSKDKNAKLVARAAKNFGQMHRKANNPEAGYYSVAVYKVVNGVEEKKPLYSWAKGRQN